MQRVRKPEAMMHETMQVYLLESDEAHQRYVLCGA
jgi:hypothetical protein